MFQARRYLTIVVAVCAAPFLAFAADTTPAPPPAAGVPTPVFVTCYAPGVGGAIEGPFETSKSRLGERTAAPYTLDDVREKKSSYVTLACNPRNYGKMYLIGEMEYVSVKDNVKVKLTNLYGYCHDTGSAFCDKSDAIGQPNPRAYAQCNCAKYRGMCAVRFKHFDIAYGDFRAHPEKEKLANYGICASSNQVWKQVGGFVEDFKTSSTDMGPSNFSYPPSSSAGGYPNTQSYLPNTSQYVPQPSSQPTSFSSQPLSGNGSMQPTAYTTSGQSGGGTSAGSTQAGGVQGVPTATSFNTNANTNTNAGQSLLQALNAPLGTSTYTSVEPAYRPLVSTSLQDFVSRLTNPTASTSPSNIARNVITGISEQTTFSDTATSIESAATSVDTSSSTETSSAGQSTGSSIVENVAAILAKVATMLRNIIAILAQRIVGN